MPRGKQENPNTKADGHGISMSILLVYIQPRTGSEIVQLVKSRNFRYISRALDLLAIEMHTQAAGDAKGFQDVSLNLAGNCSRTNQNQERSKEEKRSMISLASAFEKMR